MTDLQPKQKGIKRGRDDAPPMRYESELPKKQKGIKRSRDDAPQMRYESELPDWFRVIEKQTNMLRKEGGKFKENLNDLPKKTN